MLRIVVSALLLTTAAGVHAAARPDAAERSADPGDKMICKAFTETGSLVKRTRVCKTKADWQRERDALRQLNVSSSCGTSGAGIPCK